MVYEVDNNKERIILFKKNDIDSQHVANDINNSNNNNNNNDLLLGTPVVPQYAAMALALTVQDWNQLGIETIENNYETGSTDNIDIIVDRITSLLLVRIVAVSALTSSAHNHQQLGNDTNTPLFSDYSTSTICRTVLCQQKPWSYYAPGITITVIQQIREYVFYILSGYNEVPYHSREHAYHVVLSSNKLIDMILNQPADKTNTYGLRNNPIQLLALIFSALIHDVEHRGIPNRQLVMERNDLAILYNDISIAENRSIYIAFNELLRIDKYNELRCVMFGNGSGSVCGSENHNNILDSDNFRKFRSTTVNLVLNTDIANAERIQIGKTKWKEAFGDTFETIERKLIKKQQQQKDDEYQKSQRGGSKKSNTTNLLNNNTTESASDSCASSTPDSSEVMDEDDDSDDDDDEDDNDGVIFTKSTRTNHLSMSKVCFSSCTKVSSNHTNINTNQNNHQVLLNDDSCASYSFMEKPCTYKTFGGNYNQTHSNNNSCVRLNDTSENITSQEAAIDYYGYGDCDDDDNDNEDLSQLEDDLFASERFISVDSSRDTKLMKCNKNINNNNKTSTIAEKYLDSVRSSNASLLGILEEKRERQVNVIETKKKVVKPLDTMHAGENKTSNKDLDILFTLSLDKSIEEICHEISTNKCQDDVKVIPSIAQECTAPAVLTNAMNDTYQESKLNDKDINHCSVSAMNSIAPIRALNVTAIPNLSNEMKNVSNGTRYSRNTTTTATTQRKIGTFDDVAKTAKFQRRLSSRMTLPNQCIQHRKRLGIRRSMDLSGEALEAYQKSTTNNQSTTSTTMNEESYDDLKVSVILECLMTAADVAHNLQGYDQMIKWSGRLYLELRKAYVEGRGIDPKVKWYENQIGFLESYLLPLARRLEDTGVFSLHDGAAFGNIVEASRDKWVIYGMNQTNTIIDHGEKLFPLNNTVQISINSNDDNECSLTEVTVYSDDDDEEITNSRVNISLTRMVRNIVTIMICFLLTMEYHKRSAALINEGDSIKPGTWKTKCGFYSFIPGMCHDNVHMHIHRYNGNVIFYNDNGNKIGMIDGATCSKKHNHRQNHVCVEGLHMTTDGKILVGGKHIKKVQILKSHDHFLTQWPFAAKAKIAFL